MKIAESSKKGYSMDPTNDTNNLMLIGRRKPISIDAFGKIAQRAAEVIEEVRGAMLAPKGVKVAPSFGTAYMGTIVGMDQRQVDYRAKKGDLPAGQTVNHRRAFSVSDMRAWSRELRKSRLRPEGAEAVTITAANFKGGVTKTTTAVTLAQGLALRGHKVLLIDADPQASATSLFGYEPNIQIDEDSTILPLCRGVQDSIEYAIRETYWDGLDLVPAAADLFSAEFDLPARQSSVRSFQFWNVLHNGIDNARLKYDVIVIDTPPSLSYITINALMAADGILMPLPPSALDFLSSTQFWGLVSALTEGLKKHGSTKQFEFIDVLLSKVKQEKDDQATPLVKEWIAGAYGDMVLPIEVPITRSAESSAAEFGTVYDQPRSKASQIYDRVVEHIEDQVNLAWLRQLAGNTSVGVAA